MSFPVRRRRAGLPWPLALAAWALIAGAGLFAATGEALLPVRLGLVLAPWVMALAAALAIAASVCRAWLPAAALAALAGVLWTAQAAPLTRLAAPPAPAAGLTEGLTVVTLSNRTLNRDMAATARTVAALRADLYLLQEIADPSGLIAALPGSGWHACRRGTYMILSRHPVGPPAPESDHLWLICPVDLPGGRVTAVSVHLPRPTWHAAEQRAAAGRLAEVLRARQGPVILGGDLNAGPLSAPVKRLTGVLANAFDRAGRGFGFTFPTPARRLGTLGPFLRIDHILHSGAFRTVRAEVVRRHAPLADHYPLRAVLQPVPGGVPERPDLLAERTR